MKYLIEAANQLGLDEIAERALKSENVHGIIIDIEPFWLRLYKQHLRFPNQPINLRRWYEEFPFIRPRDYASAHGFNENDPYFSTIVPFNFNWRPDNWNDFFEHRSNLLVRIQLRPGTPYLELSMREQRLSIVQEYSPVPQLSSASQKMLRPLEGGVSIGHGTDSAGTLGGILVNNDGKKFGLTCGHVIKQNAYDVDQPSQNESNPTGLIGNSVYSILPRPNDGQLCNPRNILPLNDLDISLIDLDSNITTNQSILNIGSIKNYTPAIKLHPNLVIEYNGRTSGHQMLVTGGIGLVQELEDQNGIKYCYKNLIELKQPIMTSLVFNRPVKGGDSGAWVILNGNSGLEWCGMIVGDNRQSGYAIHSEDIMDNLNSNGFSLKCS